MEEMHINWYPGHMKKTRELIEKNMSIVDVVVEVVDSRIPKSSKNPDIEKIAGSKPIVILLNQDSGSSKFRKVDINQSIIQKKINTDR